MSGHIPWADIRRGPPGSWNRVAGDDQALHNFRDTMAPEWWRSAACGKGPAVGTSQSDTAPNPCATCLPVEPEDLDDVPGEHAGG
ncbi:MAG: hypothetical protein M3406_09080 [Chloroflexota bacterium]|nr:hypothetical protein [Chloroflexota bacterium]